jgi:hypothetical protein
LEGKNKTNIFKVDVTRYTRVILTGKKSSTFLVRDYSNNTQVTLFGEFIELPHPK